jgi:hypothetical protein
VQPSRLNTDRDPIRIQSFDEQKIKKYTPEKKISLDQKIRYNLGYLFLGLHKGFPSYRRSFQPQKRTSSTSKHEISKFFPTFVGHFALLDPDSESGSG